MEHQDGSTDRATTVVARLVREDDTIEIAPSGAVIGSGFQADVRLSDPGIATVHATLTLEHEGWVLSPVGGAEVLVDGVMLTGPTQVAGGATIRLAATELTFATAANSGTPLDVPAAIVPADPDLTHSLVTAVVTVPVALPTDGVVRLGRADDNDVVLEHPAVAAHHAELRIESGGVRLRDLDGSRRTRIGGAPVIGAVLTEGDEIGIGPYAWTFRQGQLLPRRREAPPLAGHGVTVQTDEVVLLQPTDLEIADGELIALIGPSGSGKSTLLTVLAGLRPVSAGEVLVDGDDVSVRQADLGYVPQDDTVHRLLTPREALRFAAELRLPQDSDEGAYEAAVERVLAQVGLEAAADTRVASLSGGQRKRVAVALELIAEPRTLLLDEPTTGLDPGLEQRIMTLARALAVGRRSVVLVTHATQSLHLCDRIAVMAPGGRVAYLGPPADAPAAFGVDRLEDIYNVLPNEAHGPVRGIPAAPSRRRLRSTDERRSVSPQTRVLVRRTALLIARDRRNLKIMGAQVAILGLGAAALFDHDVFAARGGRYPHAGQSAQLLFLMVTIAIWFGAIASARQIVGERNVLRRELATGVRTEAYMLSKGLVLGAVSAAQTVVMMALVLTLRPLDDAGTSVLLLLVLCAWSGVALGLVVSVFARSEDQAMSFLPLALLPQLLFGGAIVTTADLTVPVRLASHLVPAQWGYAGLGSAIDMNARIASDPVFSQASRYDDGFFGHPTILAGLVLVLMIAGCAVLLQARLRPSFEDSWFEQAKRYAEARQSAFG